MDGILSTTAAAGEIVFVECKGILVPQLKDSQAIDHNVNVHDSFSEGSSEKFAGFSLGQILAELPPVDESGRIIYNDDSDNIHYVPKTMRPRVRSRKFDEPFGFIFSGPSLGSDPSFVEIALDESIANEEQNNFETHLNGALSATVARTLGNRVRGFFARTFPKRFSADKI